MYQESVLCICTVLICLNIAHNRCNYIYGILDGREEPKNA